MNKSHIPVLLKDVINLLNIKKNGIYVDCTYGRGGHTNEIAKYLSDDGKIICIDRDQEAIDFFKKTNTKKNIFISKKSFSEITTILAEYNINYVDGIIYDLGISSTQIDSSHRGFSYKYDAKLDMRMDQKQQISAFEIINSYSKVDLINIFKTYGEINYPNKVVNEIINQRKLKPITTTYELVEIIKNNIPKKLLYKKKHPARQYFQALRIEVNDELNEIKKSLSESIKLLKKGGRIIVISFHSLEDKIVKNIFNKYSSIDIPKEVPIKDLAAEYRIIKITKPSINEINYNNRSRSAKLRCIERI